MLLLIPAIKTAFFADATLQSAFPGNGGGDYGYRWGEIPSGMPLPYVCAFPVAAPLTPLYGATGFAEPQVQFTVYGETLETARAKMLAFIGVWDTITLTLSSGGVWQAQRLGDPMPNPRPSGQDAEGDDVWAFNVTYQYTTE